MTLAASFAIEGFPFLVGDIMVSQLAGDRDYAPFNIPTRSDVNRIATPLTGCVVSGLVQKVVKLSDRLMIAWAGSAISAQALTRDLLGESNHASFAMLERKLDEWRSEVGFELYVTGLHIAERSVGGTQLVRFAWSSSRGWHTNRAELKGYGDCYYGGTGGVTFLDVISKSIVKSDDSGSPFEKALLASLAHLGKLAGDQLRMGCGIQELFGGAFEIRTEVFEKIRAYIQFHAGGHVQGAA